VMLDGICRSTYYNSATTCSRIMGSFNQLFMTLVC